MSPPIVRLPVTAETLEQYARVPATSVTRTKLNLPALMDPAGPRFVEEPLAVPITLDNDGDEAPTHWAARADLHRWTMLCARDGPELAGGAILALYPDGHWFFPARPDLAVLWDIRVDPGYRGRGIGRSLVLEAAACAAQAGCKELAIETQDVNVAACRLYAACGAVLREARRGAYREHPEEVALLWSLDLGGFAAS